MKASKIMTVIAILAIVVAGFAVAAGQQEGAAEDRPELMEAPEAGNLGTIELYEEMSPADDATEVDTSQYETDGPYTIGYAGFGLVNSWRVQAVESTKMLAENIGVELRITDAGGDATKQISDSEDLLAQGVDALLISPVAQEPLAPVIERAYETGIPVIVWGSEAATDELTAEIVTDDEFFGYAGGRKLVEDMGGSGNVIMLRGIAGNSVEQARYDGAIRAFEEAPGEINIVGEEYGDWAFDQGKAITETFLAANPDIDGVWASGAAMTRGAIEAFQEAGRDLVPMSGENLNGFMKLWARLDLESSGPQFPTWQAPEALKLAVNALQGNEIMSSYRLTPPPITNAEEAVRQNISDDYWVEQYLQEEQIREIFPGDGE
ncbi:MAG: substrate-binding domain-containing protein [Spirochaetes bacterium]|jgi:ribose transport system substrate-binding protein|nr:substrate-binding domain-containing protein [Spirochaetota bacterium]